MSMNDRTAAPLVHFLPMPRAKIPGVSVAFAENLLRPDGKREPRAILIAHEEPLDDGGKLRIVIAFDLDANSPKN